MKNKRFARLEAIERRIPPLAVRGQDCLAGIDLELLTVSELEELLAAAMLFEKYRSLQASMTLQAREELRVRAKRAPDSSNYEMPPQQFAR